ncbi:MAG: DUF86 domain-containing protein [Mariprofundus sp.]|nr:DUF86 domain-containing protein [Mariprofundus sp.]
MNDVMINKIQSIQRCIKRAKEEFQLAGDNFSQDFSRQDAAILNITRACEQAIDLANVVIKTRKLGIPNESRESFALLAKAGLISDSLSENLQRMVGFRNIVIHQHQDIEVAVIQAVIESGLDDLLLFTDAVINATRLL